MSSSFPPKIQTIIDILSQLPGLGPKSAQRITFYLLTRKKNEILHLSEELKNLTLGIIQCHICQNYSQQDPCQICKDIKRDSTTICVIAKPQDLAVIEKTSEYNGKYFILGGTINPIEGITPETLKINKLVENIKDNKIKEVILALNPDIEGETTTLVLTKILKSYKVKITRLARGLPMGADLEYADEVTLSSALKGRREL